MRKHFPVESQVKGYVPYLLAIKVIATKNQPTQIVILLKIAKSKLRKLKTGLNWKKVTHDKIIRVSHVAIHKKSYGFFAME